MTAHDVPVAGSWAVIDVIDRPYNSDASRFQLPAGLIMISPTRLFCPRDPYRIFFPLGIILGALGVSIWPLYYYGVTQGYSGRAHAFVQIDGFLYAFIAGFLLTAIPRFTGTEPPSLAVQYALAVIIAISAVAFEIQFFQIGQTGFLVAHFTLIALAAHRFRRRLQDPPETFSLVGLGLISGTLGALINAAMAWSIIAPLWDPLGKRLLTEGMV